MRVDPDNRRRALLVLLVPTATLVLFIVLVGLSARSLSVIGAGTGSIRLQDVSLSSESGQLFLTASAEIDLPEPIRDGLDSGVPLDFILTLTFSRPRPYWPDLTLAEYRHRFRLGYYELTRHYRVQAVDTEVNHNYRSLSAALEGLGNFRHMPVFMSDAQDEINYLEDPEPVLASLSFRLDSQSLPLPLQPLIASSWRLASEEFTWQVN